jgi:hypothetical protein
MEHLTIMDSFVDNLPGIILRLRFHLVQVWLETWSVGKLGGLKSWLN